MYCDRCGTALGSNTQFCTNCGKPVLAGPVAQTYVRPADVRVSRNINLLAALWIVSGILRLCGILFMMTFGPHFVPGLFRGMGFWGAHGARLAGLFPLGIFSIALVLGLFGVLHVVLGWGLYERQNWARILGLVLGFLALVRPPFGTALGIYTLWVLLPESSGREYAQLARA